MPKKARVTIVNPSKKKKTRKKAARRRKTMPKKRKASPRRRRRNPGTHAKRANPTRRRRRAAPRKNPTRRRRRSNPTVTKFGKIDLMAPWNDAGYRQLGKLAAAFAVTRWGGTTAVANWPNGPERDYSDTMGAGWSFKGYAIALLGAWLGGEIVERIRPGKGRDVYLGGFDLIMSKLVWTQLLSRTAFGPKYFGQMDQAYGMPTMPATGAMGAAEGDIYTDDQGNVWLMDGGRWVSMQGLVETGPLGALVETGPLGDTGSGFLPSATPQGEADWAKYSQAGATDPFHAAYGN